GLKEELFVVNESSNLSIKTNNLSEVINNHESVQKYFMQFEEKFEGFEDYLTEELIEGVLDVDIILENDKLNEELFKRLDGIDLVDKYEAYQYLSSQWKIIHNDIEMIQNDGFDVINQVDPNIVVKKKNNKGEIPEVQEGWKGHILPFELV